jgi:hypothetical protein
VRLSVPSQIKFLSPDFSTCTIFSGFDDQFMWEGCHRTIVWNRAYLRFECRSVVIDDVPNKQDLSRAVGA